MIWQSNTVALRALVAVVLAAVEVAVAPTAPVESLTVPVPVTFDFALACSPSWRMCGAKPLRKGDAPTRRV